MGDIDGGIRARFVVTLPSKHPRSALLVPQSTLTKGALHAC